MKRFLISMLLSFGFVSTAHAVPWCWKGTIRQVATNQYLSPLQLNNWWIANGVPPVVGTPDYYVGVHASHQACQRYAGWSGPTYGIPGAGEVYASQYAPSNFASSTYTIAQGLWFSCTKCLPIVEAQPEPEPGPDEM